MKKGSEKTASDGIQTHNLHWLICYCCPLANEVQITVGIMCFSKLFSLTLHATLALGNMPVMGQRLGTPGAAGMGSDTDAA